MLGEAAEGAAFDERLRKLAVHFRVSERCPERAHVRDPRAPRRATVCKSHKDNPPRSDRTKLAVHGACDRAGVHQPGVRHDEPGCVRRQVTAGPALGVRKEPGDQFAKLRRIAGIPCTTVGGKMKGGRLHGALLRTACIVVRRRGRCYPRPRHISSIASSVFPLVSGTTRHTKTNIVTHMVEYSQKAP